LIQHFQNHATEREYCLINKSYTRSDSSSSSSSSKPKWSSESGSELDATDHPTSSAISTVSAPSPAFASASASKKSAAQISDRNCERSCSTLLNMLQHGYTAIGAGLCFACRIHRTAIDGLMQHMKDVHSIFAADVRVMCLGCDCIFQKVVEFTSHRIKGNCNSNSNMNSPRYVTQQEFLLLISPAVHVTNHPMFDFTIPLPRRATKSAELRMNSISSTSSHNVTQSTADTKDAILASSSSTVAGTSLEKFWWQKSLTDWYDTSNSMNYCHMVESSGHCDSDDDVVTCDAKLNSMKQLVHHTAEKHYKISTNDIRAVCKRCSKAFTSDELIQHFQNDCNETEYCLIHKLSTR
jgi:hypothetical protein